MSAAAEISWPQGPKTELRLLFENAPVGLALCQREGHLTALNPVLEAMIGRRTMTSRSLLLTDLIHSPTDQRGRGLSESLLRELFAGERDSFQIESNATAANRRSLHWTAWRVDGSNVEPDYALLMAEETSEEPDTAKRLRQTERLEAVGRLAGGVAHDFNNLLTGVLLGCDLVLACLEPGHRARKYAEEIRNAGMQGTGLVRQLITVARPSDSVPHLISLNDVCEGMHNLLARLIGENIELKLRLDPSLGLIKIDPAQAQQILLNLVLNARDAMPGGGEISIETSNCRVQVLAESLRSEPDSNKPSSNEPISNEPSSSEPSSGLRTASLPCALFVVRDNGSGMDAATQSHLFETFFTTKTGGKGTGLGLATVYNIVTSNGGLIHVESAPARGTRVSVLLPIGPGAVSPGAVLKAPDKDLSRVNNPREIRAIEKE
jgi:two-component system cell cycle sensor histidine kinase/response regulator CckA